MRHNKEPKRRSVEMEINVDGKTKRLVATNCVIKSSFFSKLGIGKKREVLACQSLDIMDDGHQEAKEEELQEEESFDDEEEPEMEDIPISPRERAKAMPKPAKKPVEE